MAEPTNTEITETGFSNPDGEESHQIEAVPAEITPTAASVELPAQSFGSPKRGAASPAEGERASKSPKLDESLFSDVAKSPIAKTTMTTTMTTSPIADHVIVGESKETPAAEQLADDTPAGEVAAPEPEPEVMESDPDEGKIPVHVKTIHELITVKVFSSGNIEDLKGAISVKVNAPVERLCLIHSGKILADFEPLEQCAIVEDATVHLVIKTAPPPVIDPAAAPSAASFMFGPAQFARFGLDPVNYVQLQQRLQQQMMGNPEMIRELVQNPLVQQLMENPAVMKEMISSVPSTRDMLERNPDINEMLNDPEVMKQTLETVRNPKLLDELIESQMKADASARGSNKADSSNSWANSQFGALSADAAASLPDMQTMLTQMTTSSGMLKQMLQAPYMPAMLQGLAANPEWSQQLIQCNPMFAGNAALQQQVGRLMPIYMQQMQSKDMQSLLTNPKALQAMLKIQQGLDVLHAESPNLSKSMDMPFISMPPPAASLAEHILPPKTEDGDDFPPPRSALDPVTSIMTQIVSQMSAGKITQPVEQRYTDQLEQLNSMGFMDNLSNLQVLTSTFGDVDAAAERILLQSGQRM